ncbi:CRISPR-associated endonuclease Cas1 [Streptomyces microflavus]
MLPRVADSLSFLYLDMVRVVQDDTGVCAQIQVDAQRTDLVYIPTAALSCLLLGPGVSITTPALNTLARHGTSVVSVGSGGVRAYAGILSDSLTTHWLEQQVAGPTPDDASTSPSACTACASRTPTSPKPSPSTNSAASRASG